MWTETDFAIEQIQADQEFVDSHVVEVKQFYIYGVLPEVIGKFYARKPIGNSESVVGLCGFFLVFALLFYSSIPMKAQFSLLFSSILKKNVSISWDCKCCLCS